MNTSLMHNKAPKDWRQLTVAITGMNNKPDNPGPGYGVARCIRETDEFSGKIIGLGYDVLDGGLYQGRICDSSYLMPYPSAGEEIFFERLASIQAEEKIDILIPCLDAELLCMSRLQERLEAIGIRMLMPTSEQIQARGKDRLPELCKPLGIPTPQNQNVTSTDFFYRCHKEGWQYPMVVKGLFYDAGIAYNPDDASAIFRNISAQWGLPLLAQQYIEGEEFNLCALGNGKGDMLGAVMMRKRALTEKGKAWAGISIEDPQLYSAAEKLVKALKWKGPLEVEMLRDANGQLYLLEINPRFPAWIYLSHAVSCNLPLALLQLCYEEPNLQLSKPKHGSLFIRYAEEVVVDLQQLESMTMNGNIKFSNHHPTKLTMVQLQAH